MVPTSVCFSCLPPSSSSSYHSAQNLSHLLDSLLLLSLTLGHLLPLAIFGGFVHWFLLSAFLRFIYHPFLPWYGVRSRVVFLHCSSNIVIVNYFLYADVIFVCFLSDINFNMTSGRPQRMIPLHSNPVLANAPIFHNIIGYVAHCYLSYITVVLNNKKIT